MRGVRSGMSGPLAKGQAEHNQRHMQDDQNKGARDGISGEGHGLSDENESRINEDEVRTNEDESRINNDVNDRRTELVETQLAPHNPQQPPQGPQVPPGPIVRWERFLPLRSLKVLLVENDDSTRHVVSALLRNCSYEVIAVANGLEAWKILEDLTNHIDLVLTEVDMPSLSGISLLSRITNHKTRSNIPVIMMSSNDSMGIVFNCLSKGAADFLVKPIRKNELKNLWQHVWRKCHSSSGSGSESGIRTQKSTKSKSVEDSENNTDSNDEDGIGSIGLNVRDGSDNGSGTQSSWSKRAVEIDSPEPMSAWDELADPPDSTCAQFIHSRPEVLRDYQAPTPARREYQNLNDEPTPARREYQNLNDEHENVGMCKDLKQGTSRHLELQLQSLSQKATDRMRGTQKDKPFDLESDREGKNLERGKVDLNDEALQNDFLDDDAGPGIAATDTMTPEIGSVGHEVANHMSKISKTRNMAAYDSKKVPSLELCLKQLGDVSDNGASPKEHNMLRHSGFSAFSRYNNSKASNPAPTGNVGSCSPIDNSADAAKTESMRNLISNSSSTPNAGSNGSSNNIDMGSTTNNDPIKPEALADRSMPKSIVNIHHGSAFQAVQHSQISSVQPVTGSQPGAVNQNIQVQHHHYHHHHHHHHVHNLQQQQQQQQQQELNHGNDADYGSASGSNNGSGQNGSSGQHGSSTGLIAEGTNMTSDNGEAANCGAGCRISSGSRSGVDQNRLAQREAALYKFRQKRKERNFDKKVRYQSRKRLAEQRPRVRGQFVRQAADENKRNDKSDDADS